MTAGSPDSCVAEVIQAATTEFTAECRKVNEPPPFGSFVKVVPSGAAEEEADPFGPAIPPEGTVLAVVCEAATGSFEPGRRAVAFGLDTEALRREQPQVFELLVTHIRCRIIGCVESGRVRPYLPARPPSLHAQVLACAPAEVCAITRNLDFLRSLASDDSSVAEELIAAAIRQAYACHGRDSEFLIRAGRELSMIYCGDYPRLSSLLRRLPGIED